MSSENQLPIPENPSEQQAPPVQVCALVDGFNMYHSLDDFDRGGNLRYAKYQKYKWLCLTSLAKRFLQPNEVLGAVKYFTAFPDWDQAKLLRHETYASAQKHFGVEIVKGHFKEKSVVCRADGGCKLHFKTRVEKKTDVNIAVAVFDLPEEFGKVLLFTGDADQVPAIELFKKHNPTRHIAVVTPIGRSCDELARTCGESYKITEADLAASQLPNPIPIIRNGKQVSLIVKPTSWL
jgi:uncharacterized LabA/DUF88 family protein